MTKKSYLLTAIIVVFVLLFAYFVYPTRYQYLTTPIVLAGIQCPVRVDRLTGQTQALFISKWVTLDNLK
jgi:hypothetical protein